MAAWFNLHILVIFSTYFTQLKCGAHLTIQFILFLGARQTDMVNAVNPTQEHSAKENRDLQRFHYSFMYEIHLSRSEKNGFQARPDFHLGVPKAGLKTCCMAQKHEYLSETF